MHELFAQVLNKRDLSRAGDLFSISDADISKDLSEVLGKIKEISSASDFIHNDNNQSVVEISITRVTSAIRDTGTIEHHSEALVSLLESCLNHDLRLSSKDEDPPHAKIASDILSCIFLNHNKKSVMTLALPVTVKFLHRGNKELSRHLSSYLSLAVINNAELLAPHIQPIIDSIISGNYSLVRVLPQIYEVNKEPIHDHVMALVSLLPQCENTEKLSLLHLFELIAKHKPSLLESNLPQLSECLTIPSTASSVLQIFLHMATVRPQPFAEHLQKIKYAADQQPGMIGIVAHILGKVGKISVDRGKECVDYLVMQLGKVDHCTINTILHEIKGITDAFPSLLAPLLPQISSQTEPFTSSTTRSIIQQLKYQCNAIKSPHLVNQTSGGVTIVKVGGSKQDVSSNVTPTQSVVSTVGTQTTTLVMAVTAPVTTVKTTIATTSTGTTTESYVNLALSRQNVASSHDCRSTSRLGSSSQAVNCSMTKLHAVGNHAAVQTGSRLALNAGIHKSMTRLGSSNTVMNRSMTLLNSRQNLSSPTSRISSDGVTVTTPMPLSPHKSVSILAVQEEEPTMVTVSITSSNAPSDQMNGSGLLPASYSTSTTVSSSQSTAMSPSSSTTPNTSVLLSSPPTSPTSSPLTLSPKLRRNTTSVTVSNSNTQATSQRISVFEPYPMRDAVQHFCEKHLDKIKSYMQNIFFKLPLPVKCTIEERKAKKHAKLHFACQGKGEHCLYSKTYFVMKTRNPRIWIHLMFLALQARASSALSTRESSVGSLKNCWDTLKFDTKTFLALVTSAFPSAKDQDMLINELRNFRFFDVFEYNAIHNIWGCFLCNHPDRAQGFVREGEPVIEGQLKEKKGKWKLFRRWRTRYFTLSSAHLSYRGAIDSNDSSKNKNEKEAQPIEVSQIRSVRAISGRGRNIPKAFEIFTNDKTFVLKAKDSKNTEQWVQCLSIAMAHSHAKEVTQ